MKSWKIDLVRPTFDDSNANAILQIPLGMLYFPYKQICAITNLGHFDVRSAYHILRN